MKLVQKKICLLGDFAVGKTSLVRRFVEGRFDDNYLSTIGVKVSTKLLVRKNHQLNLIIWDLAGGEDFSGHDKNYLRGAAGALLVCDTTREKTLEYLSYYFQTLRKSNPDAVFVTAANKVDLTEELVFQDTDLNRICQEFDSPYLFTSAKTGKNVEESILLLAELLENGSQVGSTK